MSEKRKNKTTTEEKEILIIIYPFHRFELVGWLVEFCVVLSNKLLSLFFQQTYNARI